MAIVSSHPVSTFFMGVVKLLFGEFEREEFKKFVRLGIIFGCIIGANWTLRILKSAFFAP